MRFGIDEPGVRASGTRTETGSARVDELDLYDELATFSSLSPEEQREELESVERANALPALTVDDLPSVSFDFIEQSDVPTRPEREPDRWPEPLFDLIDESQFGPLEQPPSSEPAEPVFAFLEEPAQEPSQSRQATHLASQSDDLFDAASPLGDICSGAPLRSPPSMKCESCGAVSTIEDLFCLSCAQLLGEVCL